MAQTLLDLDSIMECTLDGLCKGIAANAEPFDEDWRTGVGPPYHAVSC